MQLLEFLHDRYLRYHIDVSDAAVEQLEVAIRLFGLSLGHTAAVRDLTPINLAKFMRWLKVAGRAAATINGRRSAIISVWREAGKQGFAERPHMDELPAPIREPKRLPNSWRVDQVEQIISQTHLLRGTMPCGIPRCLWWTSCILFLYDSGARITAALEIEPYDVDLRQSIVTLRPEVSKTDIEQRIRISEQTALYLSQMLQFDQPKVWPWGRCQSYLRQTLSEILKSAGLPHDRRSKFHRLRRTTATLLAKHGSIKLAQQQLGHTSEAMTLKYIDPTQLEDAPAVNYLPRPRLR